MSGTPLAQRCAQLRPRPSSLRQVIPMAEICAHSEELRQVPVPPERCAQPNSLNPQSLRQVITPEEICAQPKPTSGTPRMQRCAQPFSMPQAYVR